MIDSYGWEILPSGDQRVWLRAVTYGPFPDGWPDYFEPDFRRMAAAGFNSIRIFEMPDQRAVRCGVGKGLHVFAGLVWGQGADFSSTPGAVLRRAGAAGGGLARNRGPLRLGGRLCRQRNPGRSRPLDGPAARETRDRGTDRTRQRGRAAPAVRLRELPEHRILEPENADFSAFNVYLEDPDAYRKYLKRLHHIAGDRPLGDLRIRHRFAQKRPRRGRRKRSPGRRGFPRRRKRRASPSMRGATAGGTPAPRCWTGISA